VALCMRPLLLMLMTPWMCLIKRELMLFMGRCEFSRDKRFNIINGGNIELTDDISYFCFKMEQIDFSTGSKKF